MFNERTFKKSYRMTKIDILHRKTILFISITILVVLGLIYFLNYINSDYQVSSIAGSVSEEHKKMDSLILKKDIDNAEIEIQNYLKKNRSNENIEDLAFVNYYRAWLDFEKKEYDSILFFTSKAKVHADSINNLDIKANIAYLLGRYYFKRNEYAKSLNNFLDASTIFDQKNNLFRLADVYNSIGVLYLDLNDLENAYVALYKALEIYDQINEQKEKAIVHLNLGSFYIYNKEFDLAFKHAQYALEIFQKSEDSLNVSKAFQLIGSKSLNNGDIDEAQFYLDQAYQITTAMKDTLGQGLLLYNYGITYEKQGKDKKAIESYKKALNIMEKTQNVRLQYHALEKLALLYEKYGLYEKGHNYFKQYHLLKDSVSGTEVRYKIEDLRWNNILEKERYENKLIKSSYEIDKHKYQSQKKTYLAVLLFIVSLSIIIWILYKSKNKSLHIIRLEKRNLEEIIKSESEVKELQQEQLEAINRELTILNIQLLSKNKFIGEIEAIIDDRYKYDKVDLVFEDLKNSIRKTEDRDKDWEQFQEVFQRVHPGFFNYIQKNYPQLTKTEIRICAYIKINMNNWEIAGLLNISHKSVISSRYRIRKKLNLNSEGNLDEFIRSWR